MSVFKRDSGKGKTEYYHYRFESNNKRYTGVCEGCIEKKEAKEYEKALRLEVAELSKMKTAQALVLERRDELTGGNPISLEEAYDLSLKKPRKRQPSQKQLDSKRSYWQDFQNFIECEYSEVKNISDVKRNHAEEYLQHLRTEGRYNKQVTYKANKKEVEYDRDHNLSPRTCNVFHDTIKEVFTLLAHDTGLIDNPFDNIHKLKNDYQSREAFTEEELKLIAKKHDPFIYPLFAIGITTALREGDICTLRWTEIDLDKGLITKQMHKTGNIVEIPIMQPLHVLLVELQEKSNGSEYVLPDHAKMYINNSYGISNRVKSFLDSLKIKNTVKPKGRTREVSIKDVHSLRHTFCYLAGVYGIPFLIVKDICGHVSPEMTALYQSHATIKEKRKQLQQMPDFMGLLPEAKEDTQEHERRELIELIQAMPIKKVIELKQLAEKGA